MAVSITTQPVFQVRNLSIIFSCFLTAHIYVSQHIVPPKSVDFGPAHPSQLFSKHQDLHALNPSSILVLRWFIIKSTISFPGSREHTYTVLQGPPQNGLNLFHRHGMPCPIPCPGHTIHFSRFNAFASAAASHGTAQNAFFAWHPCPVFHLHGNCLQGPAQLSPASLFIFVL